jgi:hypothetical protein
MFRFRSSQQWTNAMSIAPISHAAPPAVAANQAAKVVPFQRDREGDYDNNAAESKRSEATEGAKGGLLLNIKT